VIWYYWLFLRKWVVWHERLIYDGCLVSIILHDELLFINLNNFIAILYFRSFFTAHTIKQIVYIFVWEVWINGPKSVFFSIWWAIRFTVCTLVSRVFQLWKHSARYGSKALAYLWARMLLLLDKANGFVKFDYFIRPTIHFKRLAFLWLCYSWEFMQMNRIHNILLK